MRLLLTFVLTFFVSSLLAQPVPGDVFREYYWDDNGFLRVGGKLDYGGYYITHTNDIDLVDAIKAEIIIEKLQSHEETTDLEIEINDKGWMPVPLSEHITKPQTDYLHHNYPIIPIPLSYLTQGKKNKFRMKVSPIQGFGWPQNLIYGVHFRIYYDASKKAHPTGSIISPTSNSKLGDLVQIEAEVTTNGSNIKSVQFIGNYEDVNYESDGIYRQWHYHYLKSVLTHHLGSASSAPYKINWNTSWIPDQLYPMEIAARIVDNTGMIYFTESASGLELNRTETSVVLVKPDEIPAAFVTRRPDRIEKFFIRSDTDRILESQMVWTSWSPGHAHGIFINDNKVLEKEGPLHNYYFHRVSLNDMSIFNEKVNVMTFGQTGPGHHGMEIQWPGIMHLLKVDFSQAEKSAPLSPDSLSIFVDDEGIRIDWNDNANNEKGFTIERKSELGNYYTVGKTNWVERTFFIDKHFESSRTYIYRVSAFNEYGTSSSEEIQITSPSKKSFFEFENQSQYFNSNNWVDDKVGFYFIYDFKGVKKVFGVIKPVHKRPYTSTFIGDSFSFLKSKAVSSSIYIKPKAINNLNEEAFKIGLISKVGDQINLDSSDSSFVAISLNVSEDQRTWGMKCYNKTNSVSFEIVDSTLNTISPSSSFWYRLSVTFKEAENDSILYKATLDEYGDGALFLDKKSILQLSGKLLNTSITKDDSIYSAIAANSQAGIDAVDNFLVYNIPDSVVTNIEDESLDVPKDFTLSQNYPNPFNPSTTIRYSIPKEGLVKINIFNILGQKVETLINENKTSGIYNISWNASSLPSGLYFYSLEFNGSRYEVKKMLLIK